MKQNQPSALPIPGELNPSIFSGEGFLGADTRSLQEIINADMMELKRLGISKIQLVTSLKSAYEKAQSKFGMETEIAPGVTAIFHESRGKIPSPFRADGNFAKGEVVVTDTKTSASFFITPLSINLIDKHDFFQGKGSRFRIDPGMAATVLGMQHQ
jgi:hypothetical protein